MIRAILTSGSMRSLRQKPDRSCATKPGHISCHRHIIRRFLEWTAITAQTGGLMNESRTEAVTGSERSWWPIDGGAMGHLIRTYAWSTTPLGPIDTWAQSLKTAVDICLT